MQAHNIAFNLLLTVTFDITHDSELCFLRKVPVLDSTKPNNQE